jgi:prophage regulatory protein
MTERFLRLRDVRELTGLPPSSIYYLKARGEFPDNFALSENRVAWRESEIRAWQEQRLKAAAEIRAAKAKQAPQSESAPQRRKHR